MRHVLSVAVGLSVACLALSIPVHGDEPTPPAVFRGTHIAEKASDGDAQLKKIFHLSQAADHLEAAGLKAEADCLRQEVRQAQLVQLEKQLARKRAEIEELEREITAFRGKLGSESAVMISVRMVEIPRDRMTALEAVLRPADVGVQGSADNPIQRTAAVVADRQQPPAIRSLLPLADDGGFYDKLIDILKKQGALKVLAEPTLITLDGRPATFLSGAEADDSVALNNNGDPQLKSGFRMNVQPTILNGNKIRLKLHCEYAENHADSTERTIRQAATTVELKEGHTVVLARLNRNDHETLLLVRAKTIETPSAAASDVPTDLPIPGLFPQPAPTLAPVPSTAAPGE